MIIGHTHLGSGTEKVLMLHGWFGDHAVWEPTFDSLDKDSFTYLFMDYRGYGQSIDMVGDYSMKEIARDAITLVNELGWERFHIVGHSMGGMAMQRVILDLEDPTRVKCAVGIDPVPACGGQLDEQTWALFSGAVENDENRYNILDFTTGNRNSPHWINYMVERSHETTTDNAFGGYLTAWARESFMDEVQGLQTPMLICIGEHDHAFTREAMQGTFLEWLPNAELHVIPNAGHYAMQETPVNLATIIDTYLRAHI